MTWRVRSSVRTSDPLILCIGGRAKESGREGLKSKEGEREQGGCVASHCTAERAAPGGTTTNRTGPVGDDSTTLNILCFFWVTRTAACRLTRLTSLVSLLYFGLGNRVPFGTYRWCSNAKQELKHEYTTIEAQEHWLQCATVTENDRWAQDGKLTRPIAKFILKWPSIPEMTTYFISKLRHQQSHLYLTKYFPQLPQGLEWAALITVISSLSCQLYSKTQCHGHWRGPSPFQQEEKWEERTWAKPATDCTVHCHCHTDAVFQMTPYSLFSVLLLTRAHSALVNSGALYRE